MHLQAGRILPERGVCVGRHRASFNVHGFNLLHSSHADGECEHTSLGERWLVETKGLTSSVGLDLSRGLGLALPTHR